MLRAGRVIESGVSKASRWSTGEDTGRAEITRTEDDAFRVIHDINNGRRDLAEPVEFFDDRVEMKVTDELLLMNTWLQNLCKKFEFDFLHRFWSHTLPSPHRDKLVHTRSHRMSIPK